MLIKLEWLGYRMWKKLRQYVKPFSSNSGTSRTDRLTDGQTELLYQYRALKMAIFDQYFALSRKRFKIRSELPWNTNRNSYAICQWCIANDREWLLTYTVFQKNMWPHFWWEVKVELSVYKDFWHTYYQKYRPSTGIFSFPPHLFRAATLPLETVEN